jgi:hypothetical protein
VRAAVSAALLAATTAACAATATPGRQVGSSSDASPSATPSGGIPSAGTTPSTQADPSTYAVGAPASFTPPLRSADVLITSSRAIPASVRDQVSAVHGVSAVLPLSLAALSVNGRTLTVAAGDLGRLRMFTGPQTAESDAVWSRVAGGEIAVDPALPRRLEKPRGYLRLGASQDAPEVHIGAYAPLVKQISAVVNDARAKQLGLPDHNALLVSTGELTPSAVIARLKRAAGPGTTLQTLAIEFDSNVQTAVLSGSSVSDAVGTFTYTAHPDGTVTPDQAWVRQFIRTEQVPLLGSVTCNKGMIPQLRAALQEVVQRGLADKIHPGEYAGCYNPRFIGHDPAQGLSLHSWGIAVDLNTPGNQRGTVGQMDRQVVAIFKKWGFAWGGDWSYTDPMHFEMAQVVTVR